MYHTRKHKLASPPGTTSHRVDQSQALSFSNSFLRIVDGVPRSAGVSGGVRLGYALGVQFQLLALHALHDQDTRQMYRDG